MLTEKQIKEYTKDPYHCPFCGSEDISGTEYYEIDGNRVYKGVDCLEEGCEKSWTEVFTLTSIEDIEELE